MGKTRLARELGALAAGKDCCVLTGQCVELGGRGPAARAAGGRAPHAGQDHAP